MSFIAVHAGAGSHSVRLQKDREHALRQACQEASDAFVHPALAPRQSLQSVCAAVMHLEVRNVKMQKAGDTTPCTLVLSCNSSLSTWHIS
jgi:isoaspartyl peptidase/L-asparaginase-like protein (Ntn-hydrolase superfamily)